MGFIQNAAYKDFSSNFILDKNNKIDINTNFTPNSAIYSEYINSPTSPINLQVNGITVATLDSSGNFTNNGWVYAKGKNRLYQQNLVASSTTSTTPVLLGTEFSFTPESSGYVIITAMIRVNNNTLNDGVTVSLLNGTTILDSETYTQEGLASNSHTMVLHYELSGQSIGTAISISLNFNAVTGGTASAKITAFDVKEI